MIGPGLRGRAALGLFALGLLVAFLIGKSTGRLGHSTPTQAQAAGTVAARRRTPGLRRPGTGGIHSSRHRSSYPVLSTSNLWTIQRAAAVSMAARITGDRVRPIPEWPGLSPAAPARAAAYPPPYWPLTSRPCAGREPCRESCERRGARKALVIRHFNDAPTLSSGVRDELYQTVSEYNPKRM